MTHQDFELYADQKRFSGKMSPHWVDALQSAVKSSGRPRAQINLLDYGCGDGNYFEYLRAEGFDPQYIHGLEISGRRVERCRAIGWNNAAQIVPNAPLPFSSESLDVVSCMEVIEHIPTAEGERIAAEFHRVLRPGGALLISTPNYPIKRFYDISDAFLHRKWERLRDDPTHITKFSVARLERLLRRHFANVELRPFKPGFLYRRLAWPVLLHKMFFLCRR